MLIQRYNAPSDLAGLWTLWVKLDLFHGQFPSRVCVVAEEDSPEGSLTEKLPQPPVGGSARSCMATHIRSVNGNTGQTSLQLNTNTHSGSVD